MENPKQGRALEQPEHMCNKCSISNIFETLQLDYSKPCSQNAFSTTPEMPLTPTYCQSEQFFDDFRPKDEANASFESQNSIPLPPRPKKVPVLAKRHVRIHPLRIPEGLNTIQRQRFVCKESHGDPEHRKTCAKCNDNGSDSLVLDDGFPKNPQ